MKRLIEAIGNTGHTTLGYEAQLDLLCEILNKFKQEGMQIVYLIYNYRVTGD